MSNGSTRVPSVSSSVGLVQAEKEAKVRDACQSRSVHDLRSLAISEGGFLSDALRQLACKKTGCPPPAIPPPVGYHLAIS